MLSKFFKKDENTIPAVKVCSSVRDYSQEPYVIKKAEEAKRIIAKYGYPKMLDTLAR